MRVNNQATYPGKLIGTEDQLGGFSENQIVKFIMPSFEDLSKVRRLVSILIRPMRVSINKQSSFILYSSLIAALLTFQRK